MTVTVVQTASTHFAGSTTVTLSNAVTAGNTLIAAIGSTFQNETWTVSDNANGSWTGPIASSTGFVTATLWVFPNTAGTSGANSFTLTMTEGTAAKNMYVTLMEVSGLALSPTDVSGTNHGFGAASGTVSTSTSASTNPEFIVTIFQSNGSHTWTAGGSATLQSPNSQQMACMTYTSSSTATQTQTFTSDSNTTYDAVIVAFLTSPTFSSQSITSAFGTIAPQNSEALTQQTVTTSTGTQTPALAITLQQENPLVGSASPTTGGSGSSSGQTLDWLTFVANRSGTANQLNCYLQSPLSATTLWLALYDAGGNLLQTGSCTPVAGFNSVSIPATTITQGLTYTLAWISQGGPFNVVLIVTNNDGTLVNGTASTTVPPPSTLPAVTTTNNIGVPSLWAAGNGGLLATFTEGAMFYQIPLVGQTATFVEGTITVGTGGNTIKSLSQQSALFTEGVLSDFISYLLDNSIITMPAQTINTAVGTILPEVDIDASVAAQTILTTGGTVTTTIAPTLGAQTATFTEGLITASIAGGSTITLVGQQIISSNGFLFVTPTYTFPALTGTFVVGTITFSATGDFTVALTGLTANFVEGTMFLQVSGDEWVARELLMNAGLIPIVQYAEDPVVLPGRVISQNPPQNTVVPVNTPVIMVVSRGPYSPAGAVTMPNLIGLLWKNATDTLALSYLSEGQFLWQVSNAAAGTVIAQSTPAGATIPASTIIQLTLSTGPAKVPATVSVPTLH